MSDAYYARKDHKKGLKSGEAAPHEDSLFKIKASIEQDKIKAIATH